MGLDAPRTQASSAPRAAASGPGLRATKLGAISEGVSGPYLAARGDHALALTGLPRADGLSLIVQPLSPDGSKAGEPRAAGSVPGVVSLLSLRAVSPDLFVVAIGTKTDRGHVVLAASLGPDGAPRGKLVELYQSAEPLLWVDAVSAGAGAAVLFASGSGGAATVRAAVVGASGAVEQPAAPVVTGARAWAATSTREGPLVVSLTREGARDRVLAHRLDPLGKPVGAPLIVTEATHVTDELEAVDTPDGAVIAWTEGEPGEGRVQVARVAAGKLASAPRAAADSAGDQALVGVEASAGKVLVAWEDGGVAHRTARRVELATLSSDLATPFGRTHLLLGTRDAGPPLLAPTTDGFALLALSRACPASAASCADAPVVPVYLRTSSDLGRVRATPLALDRLSGEAPEGAWGLACAARACLAAASGPDDLFSVALDGAGGGEVRSPMPESRRLGSPSVLGSDALLRGPRLAFTARARLTSSWLFAAVTEHAEGTPPPPLPPDVDARAEAEKDRAIQKNPKRGSLRGAMVRLLTVDDSGRASAPSTISVRARSTGGVAVAPSSAGDEAVVAWVARDDGDPQVFLTRVGPDAKRRSQTMLTTAKGDVSEVAIAGTPDGYLVVWVDERDGNGEVYATRIDKALRKLGPDQRITSAPGEASGLAIHVVGAEAWVAFSDARGIESGAGDVFFVRLDLAKATKKGEEQRLASTAQHARALRFAATPGGPSLLYVDAPPGVTRGPSFVRMVGFSSTGEPRVATALALPERWEPLSLDVACAGPACDLALLRRDDEGLSLAGGPLRDGGAVELRDLFQLLAAPGAAHDPMIAGGSIVLADDAAIPGEGRLRRVAVKWR